MLTYLISIFCLRPTPAAFVTSPFRPAVTNPAPARAAATAPAVPGVTTKPDTDKEHAAKHDAASAFIGKEAIIYAGAKWCRDKLQSMRLRVLGRNGV